jgi:hypothetical protein
VARGSELPGNGFGQPDKIADILTPVIEFVSSVLLSSRNAYRVSGIGQL